MRTLPWILLLALAPGLGAAEPAFDPNELKSIPPTPPEQALTTFKTRPGITMELVAAEPLIADPIAIAFDEFNRLFAVEMRDYSERAHEKLGRIRLLEDTDGDGRMDKSAVFAEGLAWPTGIIPFNGGVFVAATPDIIFLKDTDGDRKADVREVIFTGLGSTANPLNVQQLANSMTWGLDNRIHVASGGNGGVLRRPGAEGAGLTLRSHDFSFDPRTFEARLETGGGQYGMCFDDYGRKFICNNSSHIRQVMHDQRHLTADIITPLAEPAPAIAADGPAAEVFRVSPDEPWRVLRTKWRMAGLVPGPIEGGGRASGYFTSATGLTIYRGSLLGPDFDGDAFVADCGSNLIHRKKLRPNGVEFLAERAADETTNEFIASTDVWFRPVQLANGPDGALYIVDMYREIIEHPWSLPKTIKDKVDLNSGNDRGRIYRVTASNAERPALTIPSQLKNDELVKLLQHPNGWTRDTAARLIYERRDVSVAEQLRQPMLEPVGRVHALNALAGLGALRTNDVLAALKDADPRVRERALVLAEGMDITPALESLARDPALRVKHQLLWTLTTVPGTNAWGASLNILTNSADKRIRNAGSALLSVVSKRAPAPIPGPPFDAWLLNESMRIAGARRGDWLREALGLFSRLSVEDQPMAMKAMATLAAGAARDPEALRALRASRPYQKLLAESHALLRGDSKAAPSLTDAISLVATDPRPPADAALLALVKPGAPLDVQRHALESALGRSNAKAPVEIWSVWPALSPQLRARALDLLLRSPALIEETLAALDENKISKTEFSAAHRETARKASSERAQALHQKHFAAAPTARREEVIEKFRPALALTGAPAKGRVIYEQRCASCHRFQNQGQPVGPDFESIKANGPEYMLTHMIDPNREVPPRYAAYSLQPRDGESQLGIITDENAATLTLRDSSGQARSFPREFVHKLEVSGSSLMPEGLEDGLEPQDLADLFAYLLPQ